MEIAYSLASEELHPTDMVHAAKRAEELGFQSVQMSDHFHPWTDRQGQSPFVWSVIAGIAATTKDIVVGTGVTCPIIRMHPATIAHAVATSSVMLDGRFFLGVGTGENLNELVIGGECAPIDVRKEVVEEELARRLAHDLWKTGGLGGQLAQELRRPADFEAAAEHVTPEKSTEHTPVGPDVEPYVDAVKKCVDAGFDHIGLHQIGPDQDGFF